MAINDNQSNTRFIYSRSLHKKVPCTEQQFKDFYRNVDRIRKKEQYHGRCLCPKKYIWACDGDCENCEHHTGYGEMSLETSNTEDGSNFLDMELTEATSMEDLVADHDLLQRLFARLRELDPDADHIIALWMADDKISDRAIANALSRPQRTFSDQMKRIRTELRKVRGY